MRRNIPPKERKKRWICFYGNDISARCVSCQEKSISLDDFGHDAAHVIPWKCITPQEDEQCYMHIPMCKTCNSEMDKYQNGIYALYSYEKCGIRGIVRICSKLKHYDDTCGDGLNRGYARKTLSLPKWIYKKLHEPYIDRGYHIPDRAFWENLPAAIAEYADKSVETTINEWQTHLKTKMTTLNERMNSQISGIIARRVEDVGSAIRLAKKLKSTN